MDVLPDILQLLVLVLLYLEEEIKSKVVERFFFFNFKRETHTYPHTYTLTQVIQEWWFTNTKSVILVIFINLKGIFLRESCLMFQNI